MIAPEKEAQCGVQTSDRSHTTAALVSAVLGDSRERRTEGLQARGAG